MEQRLHKHFGTTDSDPPRHHAARCDDLARQFVSVAVHDRWKNDRDETTAAECEPGKNPNGTWRDPAGHELHSPETAICLMRNTSISP